MRREGNGANAERREHAQSKEDENREARRRADGGETEHEAMERGVQQSCAVRPQRKDKPDGHHRGHRQHRRPRVAFPAAPRARMRERDQQESGERARAPVPARL
jgi:hypothetical protein